jgi:TRAP-type transport system small permease protein
MSERRNLLTAILEYCAAALLAAACILICVQVFYRYILEAPLTWSEEILRFLFVWLSFLGATIVFRRGGHFRLDFLVHKIVAPKMAKQIFIAVDLLVLAFIVLLTYQGIAILKMAFFNNYVAIDMSAGWSYLAIPVCCGLMIPYVISDLLKILRRVP